MTTRVSATEAVRTFSDLLNRIRYRGEEFVVERAGEAVCRMTPDRSHCEGCFRTIDEIRAWSKSDAPQRLAIWNALLERAGIAATAP